MLDFLVKIEKCFYYDPDTMIVYMAQRELIEHSWCVTAATVRYGRNGLPMVYDPSSKKMKDQ